LRIEPNASSRFLYQLDSWNYPKRYDRFFHGLFLMRIDLHVGDKTFHSRLDLWIVWKN
jgi:hypothetical protein